MHDKNQGKLNILIRNLRTKRYEKNTVQGNSPDELRRGGKEDKPKQ